MLYPTQTRHSLAPDRAARAISSSRRLLVDLCDPRQTPRIPLLVRQQARSLLRFFPPEHELEPMLRQQLLMQGLPKIESFPIWPEHEF